MKYYVTIVREEREFSPAENNSLELNYSFPAETTENEAHAENKALADFMENYPDDFLVCVYTGSKA